MHGVLTTETFERNAARAGLSDEDVIEMCVWLADNPQAGAIMPGTGGARKVRFPGRGKGKSGGYRTVHYYAGEDVPLFLLALVDKGERSNLTKAERNELARLLPQLAGAYKAGVRARLQGIRRGR
jgi:hypothetical protein